MAVPYQGTPPFMGPFMMCGTKYIEMRYLFWAHIKGLNQATDVALL